MNGVAFAGDYLSAASFLGICGMIAFFGYDGFLYSIGYLAGWIVALFIIAGPLKRLGRFTLADALDNKFNSRGIKLSAAISTLVISCFYLIPQMVGAGALVRPLLGLPQYAGIDRGGAIVAFIVTTAGMVSTTWVQFIKGTLLVVLCAGMTVLILLRGVTTKQTSDGTPVRLMQRGDGNRRRRFGTPERLFLAECAGWKGQPFVRVKHTDGRVAVWRKRPDGLLDEAQSLTVGKDGRKRVNGLPTG